jgi:hypothetical protein
LPKPSLEAPRPAPATIAAPQPALAPGDAKHERAEATRARTPSVQYVGFRTTANGREYTLCASGGNEPRLFVLLIPGEAFVSNAVRFQDGPDLCFRRLQRELTADPDLLPGGGFVLTSEELLAYQAGRAQPANERRRRGPAG